MGNPEKGPHHHQLTESITVTTDCTNESGKHFDNKTESYDLLLLSISDLNSVILSSFQLYLMLMTQLLGIPKMSIW